MESLTHPFLHEFDQKKLDEISRVINLHKLKMALYNSSVLNKGEIQNILVVLELLEFAIIDVWKYAFDTKDENRLQKEIFFELCKKYAEIMQILPIPDNKLEKIKYFLKLISFGYLGEKWEDVRRFLKENEAKCLIEINNDEKWDLRLFETIYNAIFYLVRKKSWEDLTKAIEFIKELRKQQITFEKTFLDNIDNAEKKSYAFQLASFYHIAKTVELLGQYMLEGLPNDVIPQLDFHFEKSISYAKESKLIELFLIIKILHNFFKKMIFNSIWNVGKAVNSRITKFIQSVTKSNKPIFELLYPQRIAIFEQGLLNPANKAIVINLPTSSGKTIIAEFRILQALNQFADEKGWIAYIVPTRALVNQITARLRRDLSPDPIGIKIERLGGALELDSFEQDLIESKSPFDILVVTPEKLNLLIRQDIETKLNRHLVLAIVDEAHNIGDQDRGLNLEILISNIKKECVHSNFLLLTPFIPNSYEIAEWLDPQNPRTISIGLNWQPNERIIGLFYPTGQKRDITTIYKTLITSQITLKLDEELRIGNLKSPIPMSKLKKSKNQLTALVASQLGNMNRGIIAVANSKKETWAIADTIYYQFRTLNPIKDPIKLVQKFIAVEMGPNFPLVKYLAKGIGVHHAGLSDEIRFLLEWLMEEGLLKVLVSTTTLAQGMNFPVSTILLSSRYYPHAKEIPVDDFWNLVGRAGRVDQKYLGIVGIAVGEKFSKEYLQTQQYVKRKTQDLVSNLIEMVNQFLSIQSDLDLQIVADIPRWSVFLQYITHLYNQSQNLDQFLAHIEMDLNNTYGYRHLKDVKKAALLTAVKKYAKDLDQRKHLAPLSDKTGFSPETIEQTISKISQIGISKEDWNESELFSTNPLILSKIIGLMINDITEIKNDFIIKTKGKIFSHQSLANLIADWVSGKEIPTISNMYFGGTDKNSISDCVNAIYSKILTFATWGLSAIQKLPGSGLDSVQLSDDDKTKLSNLPAMIYYGVKTESGILMRINNVPRSISENLGNQYQNEIKNLHKPKLMDIRNWLKNLKIEAWEKAVPQNKKNIISGKDFKAIWQRLSGLC